MNPMTLNYYLGCAAGSFVTVALYYFIEGKYWNAAFCLALTLIPVVASVANERRTSFT